MSPTTNNKQNLVAQIESLLFVTVKPLTIKRLAEITGAEIKEVEQAIRELDDRLQGGGGLEMIRHGQEVALVTAPQHTNLVKEFLKKEELGELTRPQLEALAVIAYRGPIAKSELEQIRGVNCSLILRNLQIRGLVEQTGSDQIPAYQVTVDLLKFLGLKNSAQLPDYDRLHNPQSLNDLLTREIEVVNK